MYWRERHAAFTRAQRIAVVAAVLLLGLPSAVSASLWLVLDHSSASAGEQIRGKTAGSGAFGDAAMGQTLALYLTSISHAVEGPSDPALIPIGQLDVDGQGNGSTLLRVPTANPGDYQLILDCPPCEGFSAGRRMIPVGALRIVAAPNTAFAPESLPRAGEVAILLLLTALLLGAAAKLLSRRRPPGSG